MTTLLARALADATRAESAAQDEDTARYEDAPAEPSWRRAAVWALVIGVPLGALGCLIWAALP
jgi:hypothetical protein